MAPDAEVVRAFERLFAEAVACGWQRDGHDVKVVLERGAGPRGVPVAGRLTSRHAG